MTTSPNLGLTYLTAAQAQKHITVNQGFQRLDVLVQPTVVSSSVTAQPGSPQEGQAYILGATHTGAAWAGMTAGSLAYFRDGIWEEIVPEVGWQFYDQAGGRRLYWSGTTWVTDLFPGTVTFGGIRIESAAPTFIMKETDGATNAKVWSWNANGGILSLQALTDAEDTPTTPIAITRSSTTIASIALVATAVTVNGSAVLTAANKTSLIAVGVLPTFSNYELSGFPAWDLNSQLIFSSNHGRGAGNADVTDVFIYRNATYTGGSAGFVNSALKIQTDINSASKTAFEWGLSVIVNSANTGAAEHAGFVSTFNKSGTGFGFGIVSQFGDAAADPTFGSVSMELDMYCQGSDANHMRVLADFVSKRIIGGTGTAVCTYGLRLGSEANSTLVNAITFMSNITNYITSTAGNFTVTSAGALTAAAIAAATINVDTNFGMGLLSSNPFIAFDSGDSIVYDRTANVFDFAIGTSVVAVISASGMTLGGVVVPTISSTNTLTNKTFSGGTLSGTIAGTPTFGGAPTFSAGLFIDSTFVFGLITDPFIGFDTNDLFSYSRASNFFTFAIGGTVAAKVAASGLVLGSGAGNYQITINGGASTGQGTAIDFQAGGSSKFILGLYSAIVGGTFDPDPTIYSAGGSSTLYWYNGTKNAFFHAQNLPSTSITWLAAQTLSGVRLYLSRASRSIATPTSYSGLVDGAFFDTYQDNSTFVRNLDIVVEGDLGTASSQVRIFAGDSASSTLVALFQKSMITLNANTQVNGFLSGVADNAQDLGGTFVRWRTVYAGTGTINTSDAKQKANFRSLADAEFQVMGRILDKVEFYNWKKDLETPDAKWHAGVTAQNVRTAFADEGLNVERYGLFSRAVDAQGEEHLGLNYAELAMLAATTMHKRLKAFELN